jgi:hypothetical protein
MAGLEVASNKEPKKDEFGRSILKLPLFYGITGVIFGVATLVVLAFPLFGWVKKGDEWGWFACVVMAAGFGLIFLLGGFVLEIRVGEVDIVQRTVLGKYKSIFWGEVTSVRYNIMAKQLEISNGIQKIRCHVHLKGFPVLLRIVYQRFGLTGKKLRIAEYRDFPVFSGNK